MEAGIGTMWKNKSQTDGFTLVEMLVALLMAGIVMTAIYNLFIQQNRSQWLQDQVAEMQANARVAIERITYDIRMSGFGMIAGHQVGYTEVGGLTDPLLGTDGGTADPDQFTVYYAERAAADCGVPDLTLAGNMPAGSSEARVSEDIGSAPYNVWDDGFTCGGESFAGQSPFIEFKAIIICDAQHGGCDPPKADVVVITSVQNLGGGTDDGIQNRPYEGFDNKVLNSFPAGSTIKFFGSNDFNGYTYRVDRTDPANPRLLRYTSGAGDPATDTLAENIEDLQLVYIDNNGVEYNGTAGVTVADIRAVRITVLARTEREDPDRKRAGAGNTRPALENRNGSGTHDGYHRRVMTSTVQIRNFGI